MTASRWAAVSVAAAAAALVLAAPAGAADDGRVSFSGTVNGQDIERIDAGDPVRLDPDQGVEFELQVRNGTDAEVTVRSVRFDARVVGLVFFTYTTRVDLVVPPGDTGERAFTVDIGDLGGQARGLLPAQVSLLSQTRDVVSSRDVATDVDGSLRSVYAVFGLAVLAMTGLILTGLLLRLSRGALPANRWQRAAAFATPGVGIGLTLTFTLSTLRLVLPSAAFWVPLVVGGAAAGLVAGWLTPAPDDEDDDDDLTGSTDVDADDAALLERYTVPPQKAPPTIADLTPAPATTPEGS
jgi:hypothetical protein